MIPLKIQKPIWKSRSVGIAEHKVSQAGIELEIMYKDKYGQRLYPHLYYISREKISKYPVQVIFNNIKLRIVPINDLEVKELR